MANEEKVYCEGTIPITIDPVYWDEWDQEPEAPVTGWLLPPIVSGIWAAVLTKQSNLLLLDMIYRAKAVYECIRNTWNDFCLWSKQRQEPWGVWSCQIGYAEPSENPTWRMKFTIEVKSWENMHTLFYASRKNAKWYVIVLTTPITIF